MMGGRVKILAFVLAAVVAARGVAAATDADERMGKAAIEQQKAISAIIAALKEARKFVVDPKKNKKKKTSDKKSVKKRKNYKNPFKDKQTDKKKNMAPEKNPELKLKALADKQKKVLDSISSSSQNARRTPGKKKNSPAEKSASSTPAAKNASKPSTQAKKTNAAKKTAASADKRKNGKSALDPERRLKTQREVSKGLKEILDAKSLPKTAEEKAASAENASREAAEALLSDAAKTARAKAAEALANIESAIDRLGKESDKATKKALDEAAKKLNDAKRSLDAGNAEKAKAKMKETLKNVRAEAEKQNLQGKRSNALELAKIADKTETGNNFRKAMKSNDRKALEKALAEMDKKIATARWNGKNRLKMAKEAADKLKRLAKEFKAISKKPDKVPKKDLEASLRDAELAMKDAKNALDKLSPLSGKKPHFKDYSKKPAALKPLANTRKQEGKNAPAPQPSNSGKTSPAAAKPGNKPAAKPGGKTASKQGNKPAAKPGGKTASKQGNKPAAKPSIPSGKPSSSSAPLRGGWNRDFALWKQSRLSNGAIVTETIREMEKILLDANRKLAALKNTKLVREYNDDEVPEKYRGDVAKYFERLSDRGKRGGKTNPDKKSGAK